MTKPNIIHPATASNRGITAESLSAVADWNGEAGATAYKAGDDDLAARLWRQADLLNATAQVLRLSRKAA